MVTVTMATNERYEANALVETLIVKSPILKSIVIFKN